MVKEQYLINEAAKEVHVESHVLRYWEEELNLPIGRNEQGHRVYTQGDIEKLIKIKNLKDQGLQLKAVRTMMEPEKPRFQYLFQKLIREVVAANNEEMAELLTKRISDNIRQDMAKELDYQFRLSEERTEAKMDERSEEHYRQIDVMLRKYNDKTTKDADKDRKVIHFFKRTKKNATP